MGIYTPVFSTFAIMNRPLILAYAALATVCIVWGTTYFAMRVGVTTFPAFLFSGVRQTIAGGILLLILRLVRKNRAFPMREMLRQAVPGFLMITLGNGVVGWSEKYIPSGLAALIVSIMPVYVVIVTFISGADRNVLNIKVAVGLLLGCLGILLMFSDNISDLANPDYFAGMVVAFLAALAFAAGSVYTKYRPSKTDALTNAALQMFFGGVVLLIFSIFLDDFSTIPSISANSLWALLYLIIIGSLLSYPCFVYALEKLPIGLASIYAYINPFIALFLGYFFLDEKLTWITGLALLAAMGGIYFIKKGQRITVKP